MCQFHASRTDEEDVRIASGTPGDRVVAMLLAAMLALASPVAAGQFDSERAGHPLRFVAYVIHPVGVAIEYLFMRPGHWLVSQEPFKTAFGHED